ncbi:MAG TPA: winged helix-turn-helix domain-containing protein [Steroidobacteraceae bacterium]|nr:winged helix-turn-helix domain-containing protein [Steroidobacteraceae bacterium]
MPDKLFYCFDDFRLDAHTRVLYRGDDVVRIEPKIVDMLLLLVQRQGMVISKDELMKGVWADTIVEESAIRRNISLLRSALDPANTDRYIETLPRQGYRFRVPVTQLNGNAIHVSTRETNREMSDAQSAVQAYNQSNGQSPSQSSSQSHSQAFNQWSKPAESLVEQQPVTHRHPLLHRTYVWLGVLLLVIAGMAGYRHVMQGRQSGDVTGVRQVTTNSEELPIICSAISPDGRMIAFADETNLFVSDITAIERHVLQLPEGLVPGSIAWSSDSIHLLVSGIDAVSHEAMLWKVPVLGGKVELLAHNGRMAMFSADSRRMVFVRDNQLWIAAGDGSDARLFATAPRLSSFARPQFSQDGLYILYSVLSEEVTESRIEARNIATGTVTVLYRAPQRILDFRLVNNDELVLTQQMSRGSNASQLLSVTVNIARGFHSMARVLVSAPDDLQTELGATQDGKTLLMIRSRFFSTVQIADLSANGVELSNSKRLTLNDSQNLPSAWMPDSRSVLFFSNRTGHYGIFQQDISASDAHALVSDDHDYIRPVVSADAHWLFYFRPEDVTQQTPDLKIAMLRQAIDDTHAQVIDTRADFYRSLRCASQINQCVLVEHQGQQAVFYAFDPQQGRGAVLASVHWVPAITAFYWDLSADAARIAYLDATKGPDDITIVDVQKQPAESHSIHVKGYDPFATLYWDAQGTGFYVSSYNSSGDLLKMLHVALDGHVDVLRQQPSTQLSWAIPSPDGRHLMFQKFARKSNIWLLQRQ